MNASNQPNESPVPDINNPNSPVRQILDRITVLGVVDTHHLRGMPRNQRDQVLRQLEDAGWITPLPTGGHLRAGRAGRPPSTYQLTDEGAARARDLGYDHAYAYGQTNAVNQAHDICTLDIRLAAEANGLGVVTERVRRMDSPHTMRPDNEITLPNGRIKLFETEGAANYSQRPRLVDKIMSWNAAAPALKQAHVDLNVPILVNQKPGRGLEQTFEIHTQALAIVQASIGKPLEIKFWGKNLSAFLESPNWETLDDSFIRLDDPARVADFGLSPEQEKAFDAPLRATDLLPDVLRRQPVAYERDCIRLRAHARYFAHYLLPEIPTLSSSFFDLVREIHTIAFSDPNNSGDIASSFSIPVVALMTLRTYILHYPDLHQALTQTWRRLKRASGIMMAVREADHMVRIFLDFHGLRHDHPACRIWVASPDFGDRSNLSVCIRLRLPRPTPEMPADQWRDFELETAGALAWVLQQLLDYPEILGIDHSPNTGSAHKKSKQENGS